LHDLVCEWLLEALQSSDSFVNRISLALSQLIVMLDLDDLKGRLSNTDFKRICSSRPSKQRRGFTMFRTLCKVAGMTLVA
jgi:hypothetical protein